MLCQQAVLRSRSGKGTKKNAELSCSLAGNELAAPNPVSRRQAAEPGEVLMARGGFSAPCL